MSPRCINYVFNFQNVKEYGLSSQMKRAAISDPSNIAEGYKRLYLGEYLHFCGIAKGSAAELETQLILTE
ncbi:MAG: four helix bundle protein [Candidatus Saccharimonadales bacterium]